MATRLHVLLDDVEITEIRVAAARSGMSVSEWVRQALRNARRVDPVLDARRKLSVIRLAALHRYPTGSINKMLGEIERGRECHGAS